MQVYINAIGNGVLPVHEIYKPPKWLMAPVYQ